MNDLENTSLGIIREKVEEHLQLMEFKSENNNSRLTRNVYLHRAVDCKELLSFIDDLESEVINKSLEEAAEDCYYRNHAFAKESFLEGALWMKDHLHGIKKQN